MAAATDVRSQLEAISKVLEKRITGLKAVLETAESEHKAVLKALSALPPKEVRP